MDLLAACRVLVQLDEQGSVSGAAASAGVPQSVASRRLAALEEHLGVTVVDRTSRRSTLSDAGRRLMPSARRLVQLADLLEADAETVRVRPLGLALPDGVPDRAAAALDADSWKRGMPLAIHTMPLPARVEALTTGAVDVALVPVPAGEATWRVPLGCASAAPLGRGPLRLEALRPVRAAGGRPVGAPLAGAGVALLPEDDVPHVRDVLQRAADAEGLGAGAVRVARSRAAAIGAALGRGGLALLAESEARAAGLCWTPLAAIELTRGYRLHGVARLDEEALLTRFSSGIADCLGAPR